MANVLEFEMRNTVEVDIDKLTEELEISIPTILYDYQGLTDDELEVVDFDAVKKAIARKWLGE